MRWSWRRTTSRWIRWWEWKAKRKRIPKEEEKVKSSQVLCHHNTTYWSLDNYSCWWLFEWWNLGRHQLVTLYPLSKSGLLAPINMLMQHKWHELLCHMHCIECIHVIWRCIISKLVYVKTQCKVEEIQDVNLHCAGFWLLDIVNPRIFIATSIYT